VTGVHFGSDGVLVRKALRRLEDGPRSSVDLAAEVLGMHGCPPAMARRLVAQLLDGMPEVARDEEGGDAWRLAGGGRRTRKPTARRLHDLRYAVVDVETNGGIAGRNGRVVEIAIVDVDRGAIGGCYSTLVDAGVAIPPWITRLTGIRTEMTHGAPSFSQICDRVRGRLRGRVFVAHNAAYDWGFLRAEMLKEEPLTDDSLKLPNKSAAMNLKSCNLRFKQINFDPHENRYDLFDLAADPGCICNLWDEPAFREVRAEMARALLFSRWGLEPLWMPRVSGA